MELEDRFQNELERRASKQALRQLSLNQGLIDFSSNDYLGLSTRNGFNKRAGLEVHGSGGSRLLAGNYTLHEELESLLGDVHKAEAALLFNSGYVANLGFFSTVPQKGDVVLYDEKIHACVKDGMRLSLAKHYSFKHNDLLHLERKLIQFSGLTVFVAVESIYSMDGDAAPLKEMVSLVQKYNANLVVDEAHSTAIYGENGGGLCIELNIEKEVFARIHTFGKGVGAHGACVVGSEGLKKYLINFSRQFIYTTSMPPSYVQHLIDVYEYLKVHWSDLQKDLRERIACFKSYIEVVEINSDSPIQAVLVSGNENVKKVSKELQSKGFDVRPVLSPTVPIGLERLRLCLHNHNSLEEIKNVCLTINKLKK